MNKMKLLNLLLITVLTTSTFIGCGLTGPIKYTEPESLKIYEQIDKAFLGGKYLDEKDIYHIVLTKPVAQVIEAMQGQGDDNSLALEALNSSLTKNAPKQPIFEQGQYTLQQLTDTSKKLVNTELWEEYDIKSIAISESTNKVSVRMTWLTREKEDKLNKIVEELTGYTSILDFEEVDPDIQIQLTDEYIEFV